MDTNGNTLRRVEFAPGVQLTMPQFRTLMEILNLDPEMTWHPNDCGCCIGVHAKHGDYVIGDDGEYDFFPKDKDHETPQD